MIIIIDDNRGGGTTIEEQLLINKHKRESIDIFRSDLSRVASK